jgi:hypothetical protein
MFAVLPLVIGFGMAFKWRKQRRGRQLKKKGSPYALTYALNA